MASANAEAILIDDKITWKPLPQQQPRKRSYRPWATSPSAAGGRKSEGAVCAAVDKIKDQRKPADFIGSPQTGNDPQPACRLPPCNPNGRQKMASAETEAILWVIQIT